MFHWLKKLKKGEVIQVKGSFQVTLVVDAAPLAVASPEDLGPVNVPLAAGAKLAILGGVPPYKTSNLGGNVPPGVTINTDGSLSGTPTQAGSFDISIDVADANG